MASKNRSIKSPTLFFIKIAEPITISVTPSARLPMPGIAPIAFFTAEDFKESKAGAIMD